MEKINWENGELIKEAFVEIDGVEYEVTPEEVEGTTPLDADNLNLMQDNIEDAIDELKQQKILWSGAYYMTALHVANLSERVNQQNTGIVLIWSGYTNGQIQDYNFHCQFIPKKMVEMFPGKGYPILLSEGDGLNGHKYVYIFNDKIQGNSNNEGTNTKNGVTYNNSKYVLRYVIGV